MAGRLLVCSGSWVQLLGPCNPLDVQSAFEPACCALRGCLEDKWINRCFRTLYVHRRRQIRAFRGCNACREYEKRPTRVGKVVEALQRCFKRRGHLRAPLLAAVCLFRVSNPVDAKPLWERDKSRKRWCFHKADSILVRSGGPGSSCTGFAATRSSGAGAQPIPCQPQSGVCHPPLIPASAAAPAGAAWRAPPGRRCPRARAPAGVQPAAVAVCNSRGQSGARCSDPPANNADIEHLPVRGPAPCACSRQPAAGSIHHHPPAEGWLQPPPPRVLPLVLYEGCSADPAAPQGTGTGCAPRTVS